MAILMAASVSGQVVRINTDTSEHEVVFKSSDDEPFMGICQDEEFLLVDQTRIYVPSPDFHQMNVYGDRLYTTAAKRNQIWIFNKNLKRLNNAQYAWESHDFQIADGKMMAICSTSGRDKKIFVCGG